MKRRRVKSPTCAKRMAGSSRSWPRWCSRIDCQKKRDGRTPVEALGGAPLLEPDSATGAAARGKGGVGGSGTVAAGAGLAATDREGHFLSESSVYRILEAYDLIPSPAFIVLSAAKSFRHPTRRPNELWQTDFTYHPGDASRRAVFRFRSHRLPVPVARQPHGVPVLTSHVALRLPQASGPQDPGPGEPRRARQSWHVNLRRTAVRP